uniref:Putative methyltransferase n=1 Tax=viral metagenome TaxID=1070528 RepID=A0A6M3L049_9ZZZZ
MDETKNTWREEFKAQYDAVYRSPELDNVDLRPWMKHFQPEPNSRILELGCGAGANVIHYTRLGHRVCGVEVSSVAIDIYHRRKPAEIQAPIYQGFIEDFRLEEGDPGYDYVILTEVLEHVADPELVLRVARNCLKDGGKIYISAPNIPDDNPRHVRAVTRTDLEKWLEGFVVLWWKEFKNRIYAQAAKLERLPIVVCRPLLTPHPPHMESFQKWILLASKKHDLIPVTQYFRALHQAQAAAVHVAIRNKASHILFTEADQWGYPDDGLDTLLEADKDVIGFRTYKRIYPFQNLCMRKERPELSMILPPAEQIRKGVRLIPFGRGKDQPEIQEADLLTWAFTLVKTSVFERMREAWGNMLISQLDLKALINGDEAAKERFREYTKKPLGLEPFRQWGPHPTDSFFCQYCEDLGIKRYVHFGHTIGHGDVGPEDILISRRMEESKRMQDRTFYQAPEQVKNEDDYGNPYGPDIQHKGERYQLAHQSEYGKRDGNGRIYVSAEDIDKQRVEALDVRHQ